MKESSAPGLQPDQKEKPKPKLAGLLELFFAFFKIGAVTFGGGLAMLPILEQELAEKRDDQGFFPA